MSIEARKEYLRAIRDRYRKACRDEKTGILNEFCAVCGYTRKYAIRILGSTGELKRGRPGPEPRYDLDVVRHLRMLWLSMNQVCSKKIKAAIPHWLPHYTDTGLTDPIRAKLLEISPATIDRLLAPYRRQFRKGLSSTRPDLKIKNRIPIRLVIGREIARPGYLEADTVAHCGESLQGFFVNSLTLTDLFSGWTENRATWTKGMTPVLEAIREVEAKLPFSLWGFACDNGSEFLNHELLKYLQGPRREKEKRVEFVRRRPYKKNDNAHVEQKNWTHVRQLFGYDRLEDRALVLLMNEIYREYWNPMQNFFLPSTKLIDKTRIGGRIQKKYDIPRTPYQRLLESADVSPEAKAALKARYERMNPFELKAQLQDRLQTFFEQVRRQQFRMVG